MATSIVMPQMGYDMQEGTVTRWRKNEGDAVSRGDVIADIETDKATVEFEAFTAGVLRKIVAQEGVVIPVGELIAVITAPDEPLPEGLLDGPAPPPGDGPEAAIGGAKQGEALAAVEAAASGAPAPDGEVPSEVRASPIARRLAREQGLDLARITGTGPGGRIVEADVLAYRETSDPAVPAGEIRASPIAKRLARERGLDLARIPGTGPGGRIVEADVLAYRETPDAAAAEAPETEAFDERVELSRMRQTIARVTSDSKREAPHFYVTAEIDMTKAMELRRDINDGAVREQRVSVNDLMIKACAVALGRHPKFNASFRGDHLQMNASMNIGIAIALEAGLMVPGISGCESKDLLEIASASADLISRANSGTLRNEEYSGTTFSVSNLGMFDVESFSAIIYPPHAAVLAVGAVKEQPVVRGGQLAVAQIMKATLSVDHRVADGAEAAQFLMEVKRLLESPVNLVL